MKADRAFRSRAIGGPGAKPAREWQMRQGVEPVCRRRRRGRFVNRPYEGNEGCGIHRVWCDVRPAGGASPSPTKHRRNPNHVCRGGGLPCPHAAPVPCRPSASRTAVPEPIQIIARQSPGESALTSRFRGGGVGARRVKPRRRGRLGSQSGEQTCLRPGSSLQKVPHRRLFFLTPARRILSFRQGRKERMGVAKA